MKRNRRRLSRLPVSGIFGSLRTPMDVELLDLSRRGVRFETANKLTVGEHYFLELSYSGSTVNLEVVVKWCSQKGADQDETPEPALFEAGASFVDVHRDAPTGIWEGLEADIPPGRIRPI